MPNLYNRHHKNIPEDAVYIGRGTPWSNPYSHGNIVGTIPVGTREEAIREFKMMIQRDTRFRELIIRELSGKDLVCSCVPLPCHGDILLEVANGIQKLPLEE